MNEEKLAADSCAQGEEEETEPPTVIGEFKFTLRGCHAEVRADSSIYDGTLLKVKVPGKGVCYLVLRWDGAKSVASIRFPEPVKKLGLELEPIEPEDLIPLRAEWSIRHAPTPADLAAWGKFLADNESRLPPDVVDKLVRVIEVEKERL